MKWTFGIFALLLILKIIVGTVLLFESVPRVGISTPSAMASDKNIKKEKVKKQDIKDIKSIQVNTITKESLLKRQEELDKKEKELKLKEAELLAIQKEIEEKIARLQKIRDEIKMENEKKAMMQNKKMKHLIKVYSSMKPASAAKLIEKMDTKLAVELLSKMKADIAGNILSFMSVEKAAKISEGLLNNR